MPGPSKKPIQLKVLEGTYRADRHPAAQVNPPRAVPPAPPWLDDQAKREWGRITPELDALGLLASIDMSVLASYCQCYAHVSKAARKLKADGLTVETAKGETRVNPMYRIWSDSLTHLRRYSALLGLSPADRARSLSHSADGNDKTKDEEDLFAEYDANFGNN